MPKKAASLAELSNQSLTCRMISHAWEVEVTFATTAGRRTVYEMSLACARCGATRVDTVIKGDVDNRHYTHPDNYLIANAKEWGDRKTFNRNARDELVQRIAIPSPVNTMEPAPAPRRRRKAT